MSYLLGNVGSLGWSNPFEAAREAAVSHGLTPSQVTAKTFSTILMHAPLSVQQQFAQTAAGQGAQQAGADSVQAVVAAQSALMQLGIYPGPISGILDPNTQQCLDQFRGAVGLPVGGPLTQNDLTALSMAVQMKGAQAPGPGGPGGGLTPAQYAALQQQVVTLPSSSKLPSWALPVGAAVVGLVALKLLMPKKAAA